MGLDALAEGWTVWTESAAKLVLAYRPDVFDSHSFPAPCLPTIYLTQGKRTRKPGATRQGDAWHVTLFLEPEVDDGGARFETREAALDHAIDVANRFAAGALDYRALYQVPREEYLDELDRQTGRA